MFKASDVDTVFAHAASAYGDPATVLWDNAAVFTGRYQLWRHPLGLVQR